MHEVLNELQPSLLWNFFSEICRIPHGSKNEAALANHLKKIAEKEGCCVKIDSSGNMCISVPSTPGYEMKPSVILQAHLDMVCEKNNVVEFDFTKDAIRLKRNGDLILADGTSLGADNGIGAAAALAAALSKDYIHGPLEILFTVDEETGLTGARGLSSDFIEGKFLINLDSENSNAVCIGCAGGGGVTGILNLGLRDIPPHSAAYELKVSGLQGGHSGINIHENRGNAVKILAGILSEFMKHDVLISDIQGGDKHNAIPREANAIIIVPDNRVSEINSSLNMFLKFCKTEFVHEKDFNATLAAVTMPLQCIDKESCKKAINMLIALPNGVLAMSRSLPGLVETSNNLASAHIAGNQIIIHTTPRSSLPESLSSTVMQIVAVNNLAGVQSLEEAPYAGWQPNPSSALLSYFDAVYYDLFSEYPIHEATHAGLECGIIGSKFKNMDMISIGPDIRNCHSPQESVSIQSVEKFWKILINLIEKIAKQ